MLGEAILRGGSERSADGGAARSAGIDRIRVAMTALVILHHTAIVYGGSGGWFWRQEPNASNPLLVMFNTIDQAYFMGFFFLLAGYYTPRSYDRKGVARFQACCQGCHRQSGSPRQVPHGPTRGTPHTFFGRSGSACEKGVSAAESSSVGRDAV